MTGSSTCCVFRGELVTIRVFATLYANTTGAGFRFFTRLPTIFFLSVERDRNTAITQLLNRHLNYDLSLPVPCRAKKGECEFQFCDPSFKYNFSGPLHFRSYTYNGVVLCTIAPQSNSTTGAFVTCRWNKLSLALPMRRSV